MMTMTLWVLLGVLAIQTAVAEESANQSEITEVQAATSKSLAEVQSAAYINGVRVAQPGECRIPIINGFVPKQDPCWNTPITIVPNAVWKVCAIKNPALANSSGTLFNGMCFLIYTLPPDPTMPGKVRAVYMFEYVNVTGFNVQIQGRLHGRSDVSLWMNALTNGTSRVYNIGEQLIFKSNIIEGGVATLKTPTIWAQQLVAYPW